MAHELHQLLSVYEAAPVECDGFVRLAHTALVNAGIQHRCLFGRVSSSDGATVSPVHLWIELEDGSLVDYRARMWLGEVTTVPHGIFNPADFPEWRYEGVQVDVPVASSALVAILTAPMPVFA
ncbi:MULTISPECIES: hypothetical protein [Pseudomonas]|nr:MULTISPECIES: hypothetical protein [Pseudomonas]KQW19864.1 hypothetical protein ASC85_08430 [Pseudomonas sp. Root401]WHS57451.1 hypothetical protein QLH64_31010 [Pseudomonas brassicacearum]WNZ87467.1 hypothetical protein QOM10_29735 [Pseudomonas sp. P108]